MPGLAPIKVLIVDDSVTVQMNMRQLLESEGRFQVVATASNGEEAVRAVAMYKPDIVTMDIQMPKMDGIEATRQIMSVSPLPIVVVSAHAQNAELSFRALEAGALTILDKPPGPTHPDWERVGEQIRQTLRQMSRVTVVRRWSLPPRASNVSRLTSPAALAPTRQVSRMHPGSIAVVGIGASTGGPPALLQVIRPLPAHFPAPILVVQHIADGFLNGLKTWLEQESAHPVHIATAGQRALPGHVYLAPEDYHMGLAADGTLLVSHDPPEGGHRPAASYLFRSLAENFGPHAAGVLLTGMGKDGAQELALLLSRGGVTIAQDKESSVVHGMPGEAIRLQAATHVQKPPDIASTLIHLVR